MGMECLRSEAQAFFFWDGGRWLGFYARFSRICARFFDFMLEFLKFVIEFISFMLEFRYICSLLQFMGLWSRIEVNFDTKKQNN